MSATPTAYPFAALRLALVALAAACVSSAAIADENPMSAYNRRVMSMLRDNCKSTSLLTNLQQPSAGLHNGWVWRGAALTEARGDWVVVDVLRNQALNYKWQTLTVDTQRPSLKLALPRDLGSCAIVVLPNGSERLEVVSSTLLIQGDARRLWNQAKGWAASERTCGMVYNSFTVVTDDEVSTVPACRSAHGQWTRDALAWMTRAEVR